MNNDLISREALNKIIDKITWYHINPYGELVDGALWNGEALYKAEDIYNAIDNAPAVEERPQGEWIDVNGDGSLWKCNNCGEKSCCKGNYCPDCGAKMKGGTE